MNDTTIVYELISENLSGLGGPMGTEMTTSNWKLLFADIEKAKQFAQSDYETRRKRSYNYKGEKIIPLSWESGEAGALKSYPKNDYSVMYWIIKRKIIQ